MNIIKGNIITSYGSFYGEVVCDRIIKEVVKLNDFINPDEENLIVSGFVDLHIHGACGFDFNNADVSQMRSILRFHGKYGTGSLLATSVTDKHSVLVEFAKRISEIINNPCDDEAKILGIHLEGPYINSNKLGAQPDFVRDLSLDEIKEIHAIAPVRVITLAPEMINNLEMIEEIRNLGIKVQLGHSLASYEEAKKAIFCGVESFTHLYNAMSALHHRKPGAVGAALAHAQRAEIIGDLMHVHEGAILAALRAIPEVYCVTDASSPTGSPDGEYKLGDNRVTKCPNGIRLDDGTLAGSSITMDINFKNMIKIGLSFEEASAMCSSRASDYINIPVVGNIAKGSWADLVVVNKNDCSLERVILNGKNLI